MTGRSWSGEKDRCYESEPVHFSTGLFDRQDWEGEWLGGPQGVYKSAPLFRKEFKLAKKVKEARVFITGLGYYELRINGRKVGDHVLDPGWTDYQKRVLYETYEAAAFLQEGDNVLGVALGTGWYGRPESPKFLLQLNIEFMDGSSRSIVSKTGREAGGERGNLDSKNDYPWLVYSEGPIVENSIYHGETYDARKEVPGWDSPGFKPDEQWYLPLTMEPPDGKLQSQLLEPIKVVEEIEPVGLENPEPGVYVYDLGQNISGWVRLKVRGPRGSEVVLKFAEVLKEDGTVDQTNLRTARATDRYILKGDGEESYTPRFTYHGFRYLQLENFPGEPGLENITGQVVRSAVEPIGRFNCSNPLLNQIQQNCWWTEADNLHSIPTDCPQRDERLGWLNDMTVRAEEAMYNFKMVNFYRKFERDIADTQGVNGAISDTAPYFRLGRRPADPVDSSYLVIPWLVYLHYGDRRILEEHYQGMKSWVEYIKSQAVDYIVPYSYFGDWASPIAESVQGSNGSSAVSANTPGELMSTGYLYFNARLLERISRLLGEAEDTAYYRELAREVKLAFNDRFYNRELKQYARGSQGSNVFALYLGLGPEEDRRAVTANLLRDVLEEHDGHLTTGNQCTKYIMDVLTRMGEVETAYTIATQTTYPSWGYMIARGATTIWERWEHMTGPGMNSHNHPMYATVSAWFYKALGGINVDPAGPGFSSLIIKPYLAADLDYVESSLETVRGTVRSNWRRESGRSENGKRKAETVHFEIEIPWNSQARVSLPCLNTGNYLVRENGEVIYRDGSPEAAEDFSREEDYLVFTVGSGRYHFEVAADK